MDKKNSVPPCVLIVDDDYYFNTEVLGYHLIKRGFTVLHAYTASQFKEQWKKADVILLDIRLPDKEGDQINPWGGIDALSEILETDTLDHSKKYLQLTNCIIRSAHSKEDASGAGKKLPPFHQWFSPDISFSQLIDTIKKVGNKNRSNGD